MPASKSGLLCPRAPGHENDGDVYWCKQVCRFPNPATYSPEYGTWRTAVKRKMECEQISGYRDATPAQWAAIQAYALTVEPIASNGMAPRWAVNTARGRLFTECLDFLLKDIAKKHSRTLTALGLAVAPAPPLPATVAAAPAGNDRFAGQRAVRLWFDIPSEFRPDGPLPSGLDKVQWQTRGAVSWLELTEPTLPHLLLQIGRVVARGVGYRHLVGATRYGTILLLDNPEEPLPISEMIPILSSRHVRIWWGLSLPNEPMDLLFRCHRNSGEPGTPAPHGQPYGNRDNRGPPEEEEVEEEQEEAEGGVEEWEEGEDAEEDEEGGAGQDEDAEDNDAVRQPGSEDDDNDNDAVRRPGRSISTTKRNAKKRKTCPPSQAGPSTWMAINTPRKATQTSSMPSSSRSLPPSYDDPDSDSASAVVRQAELLFQAAAQSLAM